MTQNDYRLTISEPKEGVKSPLLDILETSEHQYLTLFCSQCGYFHSVYMRCGDRTCPECRYRDYSRLLALYKPFLASKSQLRLITLTLRGRLDILPRERLTRLRRSFKLLLRQKYYKSRLVGGFYTIEAVNKGKGWNIHIHILSEGSFIAQSRLSADWFKITGDSFIVDIRKAWSGVGGLRYILKYLSKPPKVNGLETEYNYAFRGARLVSAFGSWYKKTIVIEKKQVLCPVCGCSEWLTIYQLEKLGFGRDFDAMPMRFLKLDTS